MTAPAFALACGLFYLGLGALALLPSLVIVRDALPHFIGLFAVSGSLDALHIAIGVWGLAAWSGALSAVTYARWTAVILGLCALAGLTPGVYPALPLAGHNIWLHGLGALLAAYVGFRSLARTLAPLATPTAAAERRHGRPDRRETTAIVAVERRRGAFDRRESRYGGNTLAAG